MKTLSKKLSRGLAVMALMASLTTSLSGTAAQISNTATVTANTTDPNTANNTATVTDELCYKADLSLVSTSPANGTSGTSTTFTVAVTNNGPSTVTSTSVAFTYNSAQLSGVTATTASGSLGTASTTGSGAATVYNNTITGLTLTSGQSVNVTFTGTIVPIFAGVISPSVSISPTAPTSAVAGCSMSDTNAANNTNITGTGTTTSTSADMSITKTSDSVDKVSNVGQVNQNANVIYTLTATNNGPSTAGTPVTIVDTYDSTKLQYVSNSVVGSNMTCTSPDLTVPTSATITCTSSTAIANAGTEAITVTFKAL